MKELKLDDYSIIQPYLDKANYEGYNSNFITMMMWNHEYHIQYEIHEHFLIMLHNYKGTRFWSMPFTSEEYYGEAIDYMIQYSQKHHFDFIIDCAIEDFVKKIETKYKNTLLFERTPYNDDYIYNRHMLETLSGKKMQKRRNHYNSFIKNYPDYIYRDLDIENDFDLILDCLTRWENNKEALSESMTSEIYGIMYLLSSKHKLDFEVGGIFINGIMEAFIIASRLNHSTIQIHVEKANKDIRGLYPAILKEMLEHHFPDELYINREEDMGLENLRKSKLSLHPIKMIHKYKITLKNIQIEKAKEKDQYQIIQLWKSRFVDEDDKTTQFYFNNLYNPQNTYVLRQNNTIISALQIVPMSIKYFNKIQDSYFILGVCTHPNFERQGYMKQLLLYVLNKYKDDPIYLQAYNPDIYRPFGFYASHYHQKVILDKTALYNDDTLQLTNDESLLNTYYQDFTDKYNEYRIRDQQYWNTLKKRSIAFDDHLVIFEKYGYMIYHETSEKIYITEIIYQNQESLNHMLNYFYSYSQTIIIECDMKASIPGKKEDIITMMSNRNLEDIIDFSQYINEIY